MIRLGLRHLQMLLALAEAASVTDAAATLNITPSALSHRMREAERRLGILLFYRQSSRIELTPAAHRLLTVARKTVAEMVVAERDTIMMHGGYEAVIRLGSRANICHAWMPRFWKHIQESNPLLAIEIVPDAALSPLESLRAGKVDIAIFTGGGDWGGLTLTHLFQDELVGVLSSIHPKAGAKFLESEVFTEDTFITYGVDIEPGHEYELMFSRDHTIPRRMLSVGTVDAMLEFARANMGVSILPRASINEAVHGRNLAILPLTRDGLTVDWNCACLKTMSADAHHLRIVSLLVEWCAREFERGRKPATRSSTRRT